MKITISKININFVCCTNIFELNYDMFFHYITVLSSPNQIAYEYGKILIFICTYYTLHICTVFNKLK